MRVFENIKLKIQRIIRKIKTPKLEAAEENRFNQETSYIKRFVQPYTIRNQPYGDGFSVMSLQYDREFIHKNGEKTNLMVAEIMLHKDWDDNMFDSSQYKYVAFEIEEGTPIQDYMLYRIGCCYAMGENIDRDEVCTYLGKLLTDNSDYFESYYELKNKNDEVQRYVNEILVPEITKKKQKQQEQEINRFREELKKQSEPKNKDNQEYKNEQFQAKNEKVQNDKENRATQDDKELDI